MSDWWLFPNSVSASLLNTTTVFLALTHNLGLFLFVQYKTKTDGNELANNHSLRKPLLIATMFTYFGFLFYNVSSVLMSVQSIFELLTCTYSLYVTMIAYTMSRYGVWLFSLMRIRVAFHIELLQSLGYKKKTLIIIFIILTICFIQNLMIMFVTTSGIEVNIDINTSFCAYSIKYMTLVMYMQLVDQLCTIGCFILFFKKMRWINKLQKSLGDKSENFQLKYVLRKCTILLATNLASSWFLMLFITFTPLGTMAAQIDSVINMWTIVLFDARFNKIYKKIFACVATPRANNDVITSVSDKRSNPVAMIIHSINSVSKDIDKTDIVMDTKPKLNKIPSIKKHQSLALSLAKNDSIKLPKPGGSLKLDFAKSEPVPNQSSFGNINKNETRNSFDFI